MCVALGDMDYKTIYGSPNVLLYAIIQGCDGACVDFFVDEQESGDSECSDVNTHWWAGTVQSIWVHTESDNRGTHSHSAKHSLAWHLHGQHTLPLNG